jgi:hypothetical protein
VNPIDTQICYELLKRLDTRLLSQPVRDSLVQSLWACEADDKQQMLVLAKSGLRAAWAFQDHHGETVALIHLGIANALSGSHGLAADLLGAAKRCCRLEPAQRYRCNEGIATFGLGLLERCGHPGAEFRGRAKVIAYYRDALALLEDANRYYAAIGDGVRYREIRAVCDDLRWRITAQIPRTIDGVSRSKDDPAPELAVIQREPESQIVKAMPPREMFFEPALPAQDDGVRAEFGFQFATDGLTPVTAGGRCGWRGANGGRLWQEAGLGDVVLLGDGLDESAVGGVDTLLLSSILCFA